MFDEILAFHDRFTMCVGAGVPVPFRASVAVVACALLVNVSDAVAAPAVFGLKVTVNEALLPAGIVSGSERPPTLNTELFVLAVVTVTLAPLAAKLPEVVPLTPVITLPRSSVAGVTVNCPTVPEPTGFVEPPPALTPWHPSSEPMANRSSIATGVFPRHFLGVLLTDCFCIIC